MVQREYLGNGIDTRDIRTVPTSEIPDHDLLVGGFPCQAFSIAGKRRGFDDTRGTLFFEIARILKDKNPKYFILENVKGLLSHDNGFTFKTIISTLTELGYDLQWQVLNSKNFGVPQNRERVFIVGHIRGQPRPKVFPIGVSSGTNSELVYHQKADREIARVYDSKGIAPTLHLKTGGWQEPKIATTLMARDYKGVGNQEMTLVRGRPKMPYEKGHRELEYKEYKDICPTLTENCASGDQKNIIVPEIRRLTPTECCRLQSFPDNWTKYGLADVSLAEYNQGYGDAEKRNPTKILQLLWETIKEVAREGWGTTEFITLFKKEVLQQKVYVGEFQGSLEGKSVGTTRELQSKAVNYCDRMWEMWLNQELGCSSQRQKQIEQLFIQLRGSLQELSQQNTSWKPQRIVRISDSQRYKVLGNAVTVNVVYEVARRLSKSGKDK